MCNIPRSLSDNEAKQAVYNQPLCVIYLARLNKPLMNNETSAMSNITRSLIFNETKQAR